MFVWIAFGLLEYWSTFLRNAIGVRVALSTWLPPLVFLGAASVAWWRLGIETSEPT